MVGWRNMVCSRLGPLEANPGAFAGKIRYICAAGEYTLTQVHIDKSETNQEPTETNKLKYT